MNLNTLTKGFKGTTCIAVYIERLLVIAKDKYGQLLKYYEEITAADPSITNSTSKEELKKLADEKTERLRQSLTSVSGTRGGSLSGRSSNHFTPTQIHNAAIRTDDVISDSGRDHEYSFWGVVLFFRLFGAPKKTSQ